jgi:predicted DCC family thiol-disulfide oxidoreductase YuxK
MNQETRQPTSAERTKPPPALVVLYDGHCQFCTAQVKNLIALARWGAVEAVDFQEPGVLERFPGLTHEACMQAMHLVTPDGRVYRGFEAAVRAVATRPLIGRLALIYYLPGIRQLCDWLYARIAASRYRLMGKAVAEGECEGGTCRLHVPPH